MSGRLAHKVTLITGGSSGIGKATAKIFAKEGAQVIIAARNMERGNQACCEIQRFGGSCLFIQCDVRQKDEVQQMIARIVKEFGQLDCLVNCASVEGKLTGILDVSDEEWQQVQETNLHGCFFTTKYAAQAMKKRGGAIVNVASVNADHGNANFFSYTVSKHGLLGLTRCAAADLAPFNIRVNAVCPGVVKTPMHDRLMEVAGEAAFNAFLQTRTTMKRAAEPEEIAKPILWLCSDEASYITGATITADGGGSVT
jgi:NAD(P)-dependent dehydrogenase (short-subunit alcohol dehydrogenase family)